MAADPVVSPADTPDLTVELAEQAGRYIVFTRAEVVALLAVGERDKATPQFLDDVRAVVRDHWSGLPENRPDESVWARLDAVLYDDEGHPREHPDYTADPLRAVLAGEEDAGNG